MITEDSKVFHSAIFYIWQALKYYEQLFDYYAEEAAHHLRCIAKSGDLKKIRVAIFSDIENDNPYSFTQMREIINEYLSLSLQGSDIPPYINKDGVLSEAISLIDIIRHTQEFIFFDFLLVDSELADEARNMKIRGE